MLKNDREKYEEFFKNFGLSLKFGVYQDYGMHKDQLQDLLLFKSTNNDEYTTLDEYVSRMKEGQDQIYFASGESIELIKKLPQMEKLQDKGYEVLYFTDDVDEFAANIMMEYKEKKFKSINQGDLDLDDEEEKKAKEEKTQENKSMLDKMKAVSYTHLHVSGHPGAVIRMRYQRILQICRNSQILRRGLPAGAAEQNRIGDYFPNHKIIHPSFSMFVFS